MKRKWKFKKIVFGVLVLQALTTNAVFASNTNSAAVYNSSLYAGPGACGTTVSPLTNNLDFEPVLSGGEIRFLRDKGSEYESQQLSAIIKSNDGKIVVVDGGVGVDHEHLLSSIRELTNGACYVDAWLITHPQGDHVGGLIEILRNHQNEIDIRNIYYNFHDLEWYKAVDPNESGVVVVLKELLSTFTNERLHSDVKRGDVISLSDNLSIKVLNDPQIPTEGTSIVNESGVMYLITISGKNLLILGDMGMRTGDMLLESGAFDDLSCDFVQMSHHGQNGVSERVYQKLMPKACIWNTPEWLYNVGKNDRDGFQTYDTKRWIDKIGVKENYCTKDGDVIIK